MLAIASTLTGKCKKNMIKWKGSNMGLFHHVLFRQCWAQGPRSTSYPETRGAKQLKLPPKTTWKSWVIFKPRGFEELGLNHRRTPLPGNPKCSFDLNPIGSRVDYYIDKTTAKPLAVAPKMAASSWPPSPQDPS